MIGGQSAVTDSTALASTGSTNMVADGFAIGIPAVTEGGHIRRLEEIEADMIRLALNRYRGQMSEVARKLGIGRSTLYRKMRELGLEATRIVFSHPSRNDVRKLCVHFLNMK